jgi:aspartate racemase
MKTIGMIGGMSWESTLDYYRYLNEGVKEKLGGMHSARCLLYSVDFEEIERYQRQGQWELATAIMVDAAQRLKRGGADFLIICTNTMHKMAPEVQDAVDIPLIHIADAAAKAIIGAGICKVGLLGTRFTMEEDFYRGRLEKLHGLEVLVPNLEERIIVHDVIYKELCLGKIENQSRLQYKEIITNLVSQGAEGIILGCTEIGMLIKPEDSPIPLFDTTRLHAQMALDYALGLIPDSFFTSL